MINPILSSFPRKRESSVFVVTVTREVTGFRVPPQKLRRPRNDEIKFF
jgi:hypothetical protein